MENNNKLGKVILDKEIKLVKKLTKNMEIKPLQNDGYYLDSDLNNSVIKIKSIRKYKHRRIQWSNNQEQYVYEIDVIVDMNKSQGWYGSNGYCQRYARRYNNYYRSGILSAITQELKYFGIDNHEMNVVISKIKYKKI
jgi:hypothetical protein